MVLPSAGDFDTYSYFESVKWNKGLKNRRKMCGDSRKQDFDLG